MIRVTFLFSLYQGERVIRVCVCVSVCELSQREWDAAIVPGNQKQLLDLARRVPMKTDYHA